LNLLVADERGLLHVCNMEFFRLCYLCTLLTYLFTFVLCGIQFLLRRLDAVLGRPPMVTVGTIKWTDWRFDFTGMLSLTGRPLCASDPSVYDAVSSCAAADSLTSVFFEDCTTRQLGPVSVQ